MSSILKLLIKLRRIPILSPFIHFAMKLLGVEIPNEVILGKNIEFVHSSSGLVIHPLTIIEDNVQLFHQVTLGRADVYRSWKDSEMKGFHIKKGAIIGAGAKILCKKGTLVVGENTVVAANAVLLNSTGDNEIWAGNPAKKVGLNKNTI